MMGNRKKMVFNMNFFIELKWIQKYAKTKDSFAYFISETPLNYSSNEKAIPRQNLISVSAQNIHTLKSSAEEHKQDRTAPVPNADFLY